MATITIFLNDVPQGSGGEFIYTNPDGGDEPVVITPTKGLAIVHHNTDEKYNFDQSTIHKEATLSGGIKYVAKKYVYLNPQPNHLRIVLPLMAMPFGGKLPRLFITLQNALIEKYGSESAEVYFQKIVTMIPVLLLLGIASAVSTFVTNKLKGDGGEKKEEKEAEGKSKKSKSKSKKSD
mmetsp:Transcript_16132/g.24481  ORF Transcript_16132/g.24481 Transcript_16132/m.24481 type:complete len:179 (-) Transcript_16132:104-640(-)